MEGELKLHLRTERERVRDFVPSREGTSQALLSAAVDNSHETVTRLRPYGPSHQGTVGAFIKLLWEAREDAIPLSHILPGKLRRLPSRFLGLELTRWPPILRSLRPGSFPVSGRLVSQPDDRLGHPLVSPIRGV